MIKAFLKWVLIVLTLLTTVYLLGPQPEYPMYSCEPMYLNVQLENIDQYIADKESKIVDLKSDNEANIVWYGDTIRKTEYALVYLHGFSASHEEGNPIHRDFAARYGMNLFLSRLHDHGRSSTGTFKDLTPKALIESAKEAIAIGGVIGEKVILMSCSTGGTYSIMLAPDDPRVHSLIMYSPNIALRDPAAFLITYPWGKQLLQSQLGGDHHKINYSTTASQYWNAEYHIDGIIALQSLIDDGMQDVFFKEIDKPVFVGCYYKDEKHQDPIVSVDKMIDFMEKATTESAKKRLIKFPDAGKHVFTSHIMVDSFRRTQRVTYKFAEEVLGMQALLD